MSSRPCACTASELQFDSRGGKKPCVCYSSAGYLVLMFRIQLKLGEKSWQRNSSISLSYLSVLPGEPLSPGWWKYSCLPEDEARQVAQLRCPITELGKREQAGAAP